MKSKRLMTIGIVLALLIAVVGVVLSVSLTACGKDVITVRSEKELLKAAGTSQEKTIVLMDDVVVNGDLKVAAPNKIDLNGFGLEVKGTLSADGSGTLVVGTTALILARRETVKAQKIDINMPQGHVEWNAHIDLPASAATSADAMTVVTSASSFVFKGVFKIGGAEADIMLTLKGGRFEISNMSESSAATVLVPEQAVGAAVENLSQGAMRVEAHSDVAVGGEVEISSKNSEVNVTALESQAETKITVTDGTVKKIDAAGAQVVVAESAQAGDVVAEKLENNGTVTGAVVADEIVNNGTLAEENVNAALKTAAKKALNDGFATYSQDDYTSENWAKLTKAKDDGLAAIDSALTEAAIQSAKNTALDAMAAVETIAEATARELAEAKATAKSELETEYKKYKKTDYTANWSQLESAYNSGLTAIENAATIELAQAAKNEAVTAMAAVKNDATLLAEAKTAAKSELETEKAKYSQSDYTINWSVLEQAYNDGLTAIDASKTTSAVDTAKQAAIAAMAAVKTDAEELEAAKSAAKDELKEYFDAFNKAYYYETSLQALQTAYDSGVSAISAAQSVADVATALANAKTALDNVKADVTEVNDADSLKAAVEAQYSKIILTANISGAYIEVNYDLTLDLNGFGLVLEDRTHAAVKVNGGASFTLCDGSAAKSGKIKSDYAGIIAIGSDADKAVVEINGGTIEVDNSAYWSNGASNVGYAVYADNAEVEMWGGEIIAKGQYVTEDDSVFGINLRNGSSATVHAGKIKSDTYGVVVYYNSAFTLDGGEITATWFAISGNNLAPAADITVKSGSATSTEDVAIYMPSQGSLTVSGGHIKGLAAIDARMGEIEISGGTLESTATEFKALTKKPGGVAVYDGSVVLFNVEMYVNDNTTSRPTGDGNNDFNAVVTGGTFVSAIEDGTYFSIYLWNTTTQSVTLGIDSQYGKIAWFDFVDSAVVNIVENCLADYAEEDYSAANWQAILDILDALETELATVTDVSQIEEKVSAAQAKMAEVAKAKTISTAEQFS